MKIAIDISPILYGTGVSTYTRNIVENLLQIDPENEYILFGGSLRRYGELKAISGSFKKAKSRIFPIAPTFAQVLWNRMHIFPIENLIGKVDVYHSSDWAQAPSTAFKVTTIHDLVPLMYPQSTHKRIVRAHEQRLHWIKKVVDRIIVPSIQTAEDALYFGIKKDKIRIIPEGVSPEFRKVGPKTVAKVKKELKIDSDYILMVGTAPRKNLAGAILGFERTKLADKKLVIVGQKPEGIPESPNIVFLGQTHQKYMPSLYSGADVFLYPSFYEGFGLPILEAFTCHTPVVTSNIGSMKEVASGAAVLVSPSDPDSIAAGIIEAIDGRNVFIKKGIKILSNYSWKKAALETLKVYEEH